MLTACFGDLPWLTFPAMAEYPPSIMLMTAFNAGGGSDLSHRLIEKFAKGVIPQPIVVTYKAGAGGEIGWTWLVGAKADGYTIGGVDLPHIVLQPMLRPEGQPGYKTEQLSPLCGLVYDADVVMVPEDGPYKTFKDLIEYAKANPGKVKVATVGKLTGDHIFLMNVEKFTGAQFTQVPYPGGSKAAPACSAAKWTAISLPHPTSCVCRARAASPLQPRIAMSCALTSRP